MRLIDADALIDRLDYCVKEGMGSTIAFTFKHIVDDAPTIEPKTKVVAQVTFDEEKLREIVKKAVERFKEEYEIEPKRGEWIEFDTKWGRSLYYCTNCMETSEVPTAFGKPLYDFCPNCGARMKGADDE